MSKGLRTVCRRRFLWAMQGLSEGRRGGGGGGWKGKVKGFKGKKVGFYFGRRRRRRRRRRKKKEEEDEE